MGITIPKTAPVGHIAASGSAEQGAGMGPLWGKWPLAAQNHFLTVMVWVAQAEVPPEPIARALTTYLPGFALGATPTIQDLVPVALIATSGPAQDLAGARKGCIRPVAPRKKQTPFFSFFLSMRRTETCTELTLVPAAVPVIEVKDLALTMAGDPSCTDGRTTTGPATVGVGEALGVGVRVGVAEAEGLGVAEAEGDGVAEADGDGVAEAEGDGVAEAEGLGVGVTVTLKR